MKANQGLTNDELRRTREERDNSFQVFITTYCVSLTDMLLQCRPVCLSVQDLQSVRARLFDCQQQLEIAQTRAEFAVALQGQVV